MRFFLVLILFLFNGCGYKPSSAYFDKNKKENLFVDVSINYKNANSSVYLKELLIDFAMNRLKFNVVYNKNRAKHILKGSFSTSISQLQANSAGYGITYRAKVKLSVVLDKKKFSSSAYYDYDISDNSINSTYQKEVAIKTAIDRAFSSIYSNMVVDKIYR